MKKVLVFDGSETSQAVFRFLYDAMRFGRSRKTEHPGFEVIRAERRIFRALDAISEPDVRRQELRCPGCNVLVRQADTKARRLLNTGGQAELEQGDIEMIKEHLEKDVIWLPESSAEAVEASEYLGRILSAQDAPS